MYLSFRWFAEADPISLAYIRQIPTMEAIVTALYDVPASVVWDEARLRTLKQQIEAHDLRFDIVESVPVHDHIKLGRDNRDHLINIYCENIALLGRLGVKVICYNFMPLFDWYRTDLELPLTDGSTVLSYDHQQLEGIASPWAVTLPAYFPLEDNPETLKAAYLALSEEELRENFRYFLERVIPVAEASHVVLALHPDDPPWSIFGLPRIVKNEEDLARILAMHPSHHHGLTFCSGSLGANPSNDLVQIIERFGKRIHFVHLRNIHTVSEKSFHETAHPNGAGDLDMVALVRALHRVGYQGAVRPDHGRMIWGERGKPGYGLYDRALGAVYLRGIWDAITHPS